MFSYTVCFHEQWLTLLDVFQWFSNCVLWSSLMVFHNANTRVPLRKNLVKANINFHCVELCVFVKLFHLIMNCVEISRISSVFRDFGGYVLPPKFEITSTFCSSQYWNHTFYSMFWWYNISTWLRKNDVSEEKKTFWEFSM